MGDIGGGRCVREIYEQKVDVVTRLLTFDLCCTEVANLGNDLTIKSTTAHIRCPAFPIYSATTKAMLGSNQSTELLYIYEKKNDKNGYIIRSCSLS